MGETLGKTISIIVVDDHPVVREGLRRILGSFEQIKILGEAASGREAIALAHQVKPDVVLMDITMPEMSGIDATAELGRDLPDVKVLALSMHDRRNYITQALRVGARGYILKDSSPQELVDAITEVSEGGFTMSTHAVEGLITSGFATRGEPNLTPREIDVLRLISRGLTNKEIGEQLELSVRTVESHREKLIKKLGKSSVAELTRYAVEHGYVQSQAGL